MKEVISDSVSSEITLKDILIKIGLIKDVLMSKWKQFLLILMLGGILGFIYAIVTPIKYVSKITFVVEENKGVGGGLSALAGQFGFDLGGASGGSVFAGDNILLFLKSENLCREAMMTKYDNSGKINLADRYAEVKKLKKRWRKDNDVGEINFAKYTKDSLPRLEDSLLQVLIKKNLLVNDLMVTKPDKKSTFIQLSVSSRDELFSFLFSQRLVDIATKKYVESKTKVKSANVSILQRRADSLSELLNDKTYRNASSQQALVDANPALKTAPIFAEISSREKSMIGTIFAEVVKNLEIAKSILSQETPAIQVVDQSTFPLEKIKVGKVKSSISWSLFFIFVYLVYIIISQWLKSKN